MPTVTTKDGTVFYRDGERESRLFSSRLAAVGRRPGRSNDVFPGRHRVIAHDRSGHGRTGHVPLINRQICRFKTSVIAR